MAFLTKNLAHKSEVFLLYMGLGFYQTATELVEVSFGRAI